MILITGATGHLGGAAIDFLLKNTPANQLAALVRDPQKAEELTLKGIDVRQGDFTDYESLVRAFEGVDCLGFVSSSASEGRVKQHTNVIDAAKAAGVGRVAYTGVLRPRPGAKFGPTADHIATEAYLKNVGLTYTILRNTFYFDGFGYMVDVSRALEIGQLVYPDGGRKITLASRTDMAEALAAVLTGPGHAN